MRRKLRIPLLILGAYLIFMGIAEIIMSRWTKPAKTTRGLMGAGLVCLGLAALWDGCRDVLMPRKKREESSRPGQVILTDVDGKRRSDVSRETLREQLALLAERGTCVSLEILPAPEIPGLGWLEKVLCTYEGIPSVSALFVTGEGVCIALKKSEIPAVMAEEVFVGILGGTMDFSGWESGDWPHEEGEERNDRLLVLFGDGWYEHFPFFAERDLELAAEGLVRGEYTKVELYLEGRRYLLFPEHREEGTSDPPKISLPMIHRPGNRSVVYKKKGGVSRVQEWLAELYQDGWNPFGWAEETT